MTRRLALAVVLATATVLAIASTMVQKAEAQLVRDSRFAGLQWTFVRIKYTANTQPGRYRMEYWGEPWAIDGPAAEQNLSRRIKSVTAVDVADPIVLTLEDPRLWEHPWIYFVEPGNLRKYRYCASSCCAEGPLPSTTFTAHMSGTTWYAS
jgi:hypothetical protein